MSFKSGYIAILGTPNVGKSTLLNAILGEKLAIVSDKPQTTRHKLLGIHHRKEGQLLFLDTPGLHKSGKPLNIHMLEEALGTLAEADLVFFVVEPFRGPTEEEKEFLRKIEEQEVPYFLIVNKVDQVAKPSLLPLLEAWKECSKPSEFFLVSARLGEGVADLVDKALKILPEGAAYYRAGDLTVRDNVHLAAERIRENLFQLTPLEIP